MTNENLRHITPADIQAHNKSDAPLVCLTAYSTPMAEILDPHCDLLLIGDSMGNALYGMGSTRGVTLDMMIRHAQAVVRGTKQSCVIVDMPFGTYEDSSAQAYKNAKKIMDETGCDGVKLEGGESLKQTIKHLVDNGIPVMAHIGLLPQSVADGKFRIQGKNEEQSEQLLRDIKAVEDAGAFSVVIEGIIADIGKELTETVKIPTIGIGASSCCDGQILVSEDMLGLLSRSPKFAKQYANLRDIIGDAVATYASEVKSRAFPSMEYLYTAKKTEEKNNEKSLAKAS